MSKRKPDEIDAEILGALFLTARFAIDARDKFARDGLNVKADSYRRVANMLEAMVDGVRDPLLVALWERTGTGSNMRVDWVTEFNRREAAFAAVYLLLKNDKQKLSPACKQVAELTGENAETLRQHFKGLALTEYESSPAGTRTLLALENMRRRFFETEPTWQQVYEVMIRVAIEMNAELDTDRRRLSRL